MLIFGTCRVVFFLFEIRADENGSVASPPDSKRLTRNKNDLPSILNPRFHIMCIFCKFGIRKFGRTKMEKSVASPSDTRLTTSKQNCLSSILNCRFHMYEYHLYIL